MKTNKRVNQNIAIYPGSFDPLTYGHLDIILRAQKLFKTLIVGILTHSEKDPLFTIEERLSMVKESLSKTKNIEVKSYDGLLVNMARENRAGIIIRGLRFLTDFDHELQMALMNRHLDPDVETLFLMTEENHSHISSSLVKEIAMYGGDISALVPVSIAKRMYRKLKTSK